MEWMKENNIKRNATGVLGTASPKKAEKAKSIMGKAGLMDDVDAMLHWHPGIRQMRQVATSSLCKYFHQISILWCSLSCRAAPERGKSCMDGVEAIDYMVNLLVSTCQLETRCIMFTRVAVKASKCGSCTLQNPIII